MVVAREDETMHTFSKDTAAFSQSLAQALVQELLWNGQHVEKVLMRESASSAAPALGRS